MTDSTDRPVTVPMLRESYRGEPMATKDLFALLYDQLRGIAQQQLRAERDDHTLQPTALVHEAWFKLVDVEQLGAGDGDTQAHFLALASRAMRQVLVDHARRVKADKRVAPGGGHRVTLSETVRANTVGVQDVLDIDDAIHALAERHPRCGQVAELRIFGGLTTEEVGQALQLSRTTVKQDWALARAMLSRHLSDD